MKIEFLILIKMEREEDSYIPGEKILYREDKMVLAVEILENNCDSGNIAYKLRVIKTLVPHPVFGECREGGKFGFSKMRNIGCCLGLGQIIDKIEEEIPI